MKSEPPQPLKFRERLGIALASLAGFVLIAGWSLAGGVATDRRTDPPTRSPNARISATPAAPLNAAPAASVSADAPSELTTGKARAKVGCAGCGVIVAVLRIDTPVPVMAGCYTGDGPAFPSRLINAGSLYDPDSLAETVASVIADGRGRKKVTVNTRHQIVVRFRDGSKQVFDEATPRSLHVGDRIVVIAGSQQPRVGTGTRGASIADVWSSVRSRTDG